MNAAPSSRFVTADRFGVISNLFMTEQSDADKSRPEVPSGDNGVIPAKKLPADSPGASPTDEPATPPKLTAEEQMALYEEHLKENDWGHQPC
jgi:hypothetical protein